MPLSVEQRKQAAELSRRLYIRQNLLAWCDECHREGIIPSPPARHHRLLIDKLQQASKYPNTRVIIMMPPGSAKSTYCSVLFIVWYLAQLANRCILACSFNKDKAQEFGRRARNLAEAHSKTLGYTLARDSKAADEWEVSNGGRYFCAGVGTGIAGYRADLALIDDYLGKQEDADSKLTRDSQESWYWNDLMPRLKPGASRLIICNRRHEDDLVGRLLNKQRYPDEAAKWEVISLPMLAGEGDLLGRLPGERLWPEWFTDQMVAEAKTVPRTWSSLYQQNPTPEAGNFFKREWLLTYQPDQLPKNLRYYCASDHAVSENRGANKNCFIPFGVDDHGDVWILPDIFWQKAGPADAVKAMIDLAERHRPLWWRAEKGHISKSLKPLILQNCNERHVFFPLVEVVPVRSKDVRAQSIAGLMQMGKVHFPSYANWWSDAMFELLAFTGNGDDKSDDFCDCLAHIGMGVLEMSRPQSPRKESTDQVNGIPTALTGAWLHSEAKRARMEKRQLELQNY